MKKRLNRVLLQSLIETHWNGSNTALAADLGVSRDTVARWLMSSAPQYVPLAISALLHKLPALDSATVEILPAQAQGDPVINLALAWDSFARHLRAYSNDSPEFQEAMQAFKDVVLARVPAKR